MREGRLDAVRGVVGKRERDRAGGRDRGVVGEARAMLGDRFDQIGPHFTDPLHVARVARVQHLAGKPIPHLDPVAGHLRTLGEHRCRHLEALLHDRRGTFLLGELHTDLPTRDRHLPGHRLGEGERLGAAVAHPEHGQGRAQTQKAHAMPPLAADFLRLLGKRQTVDFDHVVEHPGKDLDHLAVAFPIEARLLGEGASTKRVRLTEPSRQAP